MSAVKRAWAISLVLSALTCAAVAAPGAGAAPDGFRSCGSDFHRGAGWSNAIASGIGCNGARSQARRWWHGNGEQYGYSCLVRSRGDDRGRVLCHRQRDGRLQRVRFSFTTFGGRG